MFRKPNLTLNWKFETGNPKKFIRTQIFADNRRNKKDAMRIALSDLLYY